MKICKLRKVEKNKKILKKMFSTSVQSKLSLSNETEVILFKTDI